ncbi:MAG TPA: class I SAM-dependent methyltransferase [Ignavibacteria bacterium]|nr:class I SAM-dependent methyltransferase [Ignavibacteria bacterium]
MNLNIQMNNTKRFSGRVEYYIKYRPGYPEEILDFFKSNLNFNSNHIIADIGSGTGILSKLFLDDGNKVFGIEPNREMREAAESLLKNYHGFVSVNGSAEKTGLKSSSINFVTAGQSFHWFDIKKSKKEFLRILRQGGLVILIWNSRKIDSDGFLTAHEDLLNKFAIDYKKVNHKNLDDNIFKKFFSDYEVIHFNNYQKFNFDGLKGRLLSSSYIPLPGFRNYGSMMKELKSIFEKYNSNGFITFKYDTEVYYGSLS